MNKIFFISGVNGVGKTATIPTLKKLLPADTFDIHEFNERGVPPNADNNWRIAEAKYWVDLGTKQASNKNTVICGFVRTGDFLGIPVIGTPEIVKILLDAKPNVIMQRLVSRYTSGGLQQSSAKVINFFVDGNIYILNEMKKDFSLVGGTIIDTTTLTPEQVAEEVSKVILK